MRSLEDQIRNLAVAAENSWSPIDPARIEIGVDVHPEPDHGAWGRVRVRRSWSAGALAVGAAVTLLVVGLIPLLMSGSDRDVTSVPTTVRLPPTTSPISPSTSVPAVPMDQDPPAAAPRVGSISWEFVERPEGTVPPEEWPGRPMASTSAGYHFWLSCESFKLPAAPVGPSFIWSSPDGISWSKQEIDCDDQAFGVADKLILDSFTQRAAFISDDGQQWTPLSAWGPSGDAVRGGPLWHGSENGYAPSALVWEIDDIGVMYDFSMPWDIGFYAPTGWLFEFDNGLTAISRCCQTEWLREPMVKHSTDNHTWTDAPGLPFVEAGYTQTPNAWSTFAHQDGIAVVAPSNGSETRLWRTTDGLEWTDVTPTPLQPGGVWAADMFWVQGLGFFNDDTSGEFINISADGSNWTAMDVPPEVGSFKGTVRVGDNKIFVFGDQLLVGTYVSTPP